MGEETFDANAAATSRRVFLTSTGLAAGTAALATLASDVAVAGKAPCSAVNALLPTAGQMQDFLALPDDQPIVMVNLLKFKPKGGEAEYAKYVAGIQPILEKLGAKILFAGRAQFCLIGQADWDMVALVQYPRKRTLLQMSLMPEYRAIHPHREAGLAGQINYAVAQIPPNAGSLAGAGAVVGAGGRAAVLHTPDERFANLPEFNFEPHNKEVGGYRMHYLDEGPADGQPVLLLHGEPTWCYLYRKMIPPLTAAGYRCIVPDLIGFGRSDKPAERSVHTYKFHVDEIAGLVAALDLKNCTFFGQDWGGLIGLRVVTENEGRFARIVVSNTGLPTGEEPMTPAFLTWKKMSQQMLELGDMPVGTLVATTAGKLDIKPAYDAPFPDKHYKAGPLMLPQLVPVTPHDPATEANKKAWQVLRQWRKPFLTAFGDGDPITRGAEKPFQKEVPGAKGQPHATIAGAGHFIQETHGVELAKVMIDFMSKTPIPN
jgi:haloalkane dehalogenase